jgi:branched-chain amino acid aminotransferase
LNARDGQSIEELGGMSFFVVYADGSVATPALNGQILESVTRQSIVELCEQKNIAVSQTSLNIREVVQDIKAGRITESFACGTAAVISPIGQLAGVDFNVKLQNSEVTGPVTASLLSEITAIQCGTSPDKFKWMTKLVD